MSSLTCLAAGQGRLEDGDLSLTWRHVISTWLLGLLQRWLDPKRECSKYEAGIADLFRRGLESYTVSLLLHLLVTVSPKASPESSKKIQTPPLHSTVARIRDPAYDKAASSPSDSEAQLC